MPNNNDFFSPPSSGKPRPKPASSAPRTSSSPPSQPSGGGCVGTTLRFIGWGCIGIIGFLVLPMIGIGGGILTGTCARKNNPPQVPTKMSSELAKRYWVRPSKTGVVPPPRQTPSKSSWSDEDFNTLFIPSVNTTLAQERRLREQFTHALFVKDPECIRRFEAWKRRHPSVKL
jgi:hypothetical protein